MTARACPSCHRPAQPRDEFCGACGARLDERSQPEPAHAPWDTLTVPLMYAVIGLAALLLFDFDLSYLEYAAILLGVVLGFVFAEKVFGRVGIDVWVTPMVFAVALGLGAAWWVADGALSSDHVTRVVTAGLTPVVVGHVVMLIVLLAAERWRRVAELETPGARIGAAFALLARFTIVAGVVGAAGWWVFADRGEEAPRPTAESLAAHYCSRVEVGDAFSEAVAAAAAIVRDGGRTGRDGDASFSATFGKPPSEYTCLIEAENGRILSRRVQ